MTLSGFFSVGEFCLLTQALNLLKVCSDFLFPSVPLILVVWIFLRMCPFHLDYLYVYNLYVYCMFIYREFIFSEIISSYNHHFRLVFEHFYHTRAPFGILQISSSPTLSPKKQLMCFMLL